MVRIRSWFRYVVSDKKTAFSGFDYVFWFVLVAIMCCDNTYALQHRMGRAAAGVVTSNGNDAFTVLLIHSNTTNGSTTFTDSSVSGGHTITANADAQHSTTQSKFGTSSIRLDGTGDYLSIPTDSDWNFGTSDFTIDFWYLYSGTQGAYPATISNAGTGYPYVGFESLAYKTDSQGIGFYVTTVSPFAQYGFKIDSDGSEVFDGNWHHIAIVRNGTSLKGYLNGTYDAGATLPADYEIETSSEALWIGRSARLSSYYLAAFLDEMRVSKGIARWTTNFTPPTEAYS